MGKLIAVAAGLLIALALPRWPRAVLTGAALLLGLLATLVLAVLGWPVLAVASAAGGAFFLLLWSARRWPRLLVFLLLLPGFVAPVYSATARSAGRPAAIAAALAALLLALLGTARREGGLRLALAGLGAALAVVVALPSEQRWALLPVMAVLFWISSRLAPRWPDEPEGNRSLAVPGLAFAIVAGTILALPWLVGELSVPGDEPYGGRRARLSVAAPAGGVLWPLPSETIFWGASAKDYPAFENLDAFWLTGADPGRPVRVPGTSPLLGRLFLHRLVAPLRARHDAAEVALHRQSAQATVAALRAALPLYRAGAKEADVAGAIRKAYLAAGCEDKSFPPIVASGKSAAAPHGEDNAGQLGAGELVVTDVGCSVRHHTADFTRTLPVGGRFTPEGRRLYEAVLAAQAAAAKACRPGVGLTRDFGGQKSLDAISRETLKARGVEGDYPHGLGHTVGLFVHDVGGRSEALAPGMLVTLEPGLYRKGSLGIRVEDTYLVTETGCEPITTGLPSDPDELEALMAAGR